MAPVPHHTTTTSRTSPVHSRATAAMSFEVFTHALHGQYSASAGDASGRQSLIASCGRIVALGHGTSVHLFDAHDTAELSGALGPGACKMRFLCAFPVSDINDAVTVSALYFLRGGHLALAGTCTKGTGECGKE